MNRSFLAFAFGCLFVAANSSAYAVSFNESGDAGHTLGSAQAVPDGTDSINGNLGSAGDIDLYRLEFATNATVTFYAGSSAVIDDNQILFNSSGNPLFGDDDRGGGSSGLDSEIVFNVTPGTYYLAYGDNNIYAYNASNVVICGNDDGPNCPVPSGVVDHISGGEDTGSYVITISPPTGSPVVQPTASSIPTLSEWAMIVMVALLGLTGAFGMRRMRA